MGAVDELAFAPSHVSPSTGLLEHLQSMATSFPQREYFEGAKVWVVMPIVTSLGSQTLSQPPIQLDKWVSDSCKSMNARKCVIRDHFEA